MTDEQKHISIHSILNLLPNNEITKIGQALNVDFHVRKLSGDIFLQLLIFGQLLSLKLSQRKLNAIYDSPFFRAINTVLSPVVKGCNQLMETQTFDMNEYRAQKDRLEYEALMRSPETADLASDEEFDRQLEELGWSPSDMVTMTGMYMDRAAYNIKKSVRDWFRELLEILFQAAGLIIDTLRTFFLIVLSILGPLAFAISVYDGFQSTLTQWISRYISIYLWLPVSDLFSSVLARIQTLMLQKDIQELSDPNFIPDGSSTVYVIFMIIGIVGYFTIPTVASWIVSAGGTSAYNRNVARAGSIAGAAVGAASGKVTGKLLK